MYERFTDRARKVMQLANQEAQRFNHEYIGTEHILLGLVEEDSCVAANVLKNLDIDLRKIRQEVEKLAQCGPEMVTIGILPKTPRAKKAIEYAMDEGRNLNHKYVGTEHILLGLLREQEGVAGAVLMNHGLSLDHVRGEVLSLLGYGRKGEVSRQSFINLVCRPMESAADYALYPDSRDQAVQALLSHEPVVVIAAVGAGRRTLAGQIANEFFRLSGERDRLSTRFVVPNHTAIEEHANGDFGRVFERMADELSNDRSQGLAIPELHQACDPVLSVEPYRNGWKNLLAQCHEEEVSTLAWTTKEGAQQLSDCWPGLFRQMRQIVLPEASPDKIHQIIAMRLAAVEQCYPIKFADRLTNDILACRERCTNGNDLAEPGLSLAIAARFIRFIGSQNSCKPTHTAEQTEAELRRLEEKVRRALDAGRYDAAAKLAQKLAAQGAKAVSEFTVAPAVPRVIDNVVFAEFLKVGQHVD